eukprot:TRINITY_DN5384_c0_g1_i2.p1 TRINITY_DN5384_c0_g1~~TRINITY_DN5384_c0_g1_i2.p1  ORF type:complete len:335 (-),score=22.08 TRINITY_DN5384_c0_g1_i2:419-1354(-)
MKLKVLKRSGRELITGGVEVDNDATVADLQKAIHKTIKKYYPERQRISLPPTEGNKKGEVLRSSSKLSEYGITDGAELHFKDLGPQISYQMVFYLEYLGPLLIYPLFYFLPQFFYSSQDIQQSSVFSQRHEVQTMALAYWCFHYFKRIMETTFVHSFSHSTMPVFGLLRNCSYYYFFAAYIAFFINHPLYTPPPLGRSIVLFCVAIVCQLSNFYCHVILKSLRSDGSSGYKIPRGFLFNYVTCANYTAEIYGWFLFGLATQTVAVFIFLACGTYIMTQWAVQKQKRLKKLFDGKEGREKYPRRWIILPPFF